MLEGSSTHIIPTRLLCTDVISSIDNGLTVSIAEPMNRVVRYLEVAKNLARKGRSGSKTHSLEAERRWMEGFVPYLRDLNELTLQMAGRSKVLT